MLANRGERIPPCGVPVTVSWKPPCWVNPGPQERLDERQHAFVFDPPTHPAQQRRVVDAVKARLDVALQHPLIRVHGEVADLSDRVLSTASGPKPIRARLKVGLKDRLQH